MDAEPASAHGIARALSLLDTLSLFPRGISLANLTREAQIPKSTLHRLLKELSDAGFVLRTGDGYYSLSFKVCELSNRLLSGLDIVELAIPYVRRLCSLSHETVHLVVPSGTDIVYLRKEEPLDGTLRSMSYTGQHRPMYITSAGKSILSLCSEAHVREVWEHSNIVPITDHTITSLPILLEELASARKIGYAIDNEENEIGVRCMGAAIVNHISEPIAAVSISAPTKRMTDARMNELAPALISAAADISRAMGFSR